MAAGRHAHARVRIGSSFVPPAIDRVFVWPSHIMKRVFVWPFLIKLSSNFELATEGGGDFFFRPAGARDRVRHPPACPPTPQQRVQQTYRVMFSAARPDLRIAHTIQRTTQEDSRERNTNKGRTSATQPPTRSLGARLSRPLEARHPSNEARRHAQGCGAVDG